MPDANEGDGRILVAEALCRFNQRCAPSNDPGCIGRIVPTLTAAGTQQGFACAAWIDMQPCTQPMMTDDTCHPFGL
jgi:hypothetical protein